MSLEQNKKLLVLDLDETLIYSSESKRRCCMNVELKKSPEKAKMLVISGYENKYQ